MKFLKILTVTFAISTSAFADEAPTGAPASPTSEEKSALNALQGKLKGKIVWSSSRSHSTHDLWLMNADGSEKKQLTNSATVDWFPRFSPDGKTVIFTRSKGGWTPENDANYPEKWELWTIGVDGQGEKKVADNATWGTFRPDGKNIVFSRGANVYTKNLESGEEKLLLDGKKAFDEDGVILQEPNLSPDGKYLALTLRGSMRETGIWDLANKKWNKSGDGCQIDFFADGSRVYRVNPTGNGGTAAPSEILWFTLKDGVQQEKIGFFGVPKAAKLMDLPGRRSHEYFPRVSSDGKWLVWGATAKGHDHDIYDYELYLWQIGTPVKPSARLPYHTSNARWPDICLEK